MDVTREARLVGRLAHQSEAERLKKTAEQRQQEMRDNEERLRREADAALKAKDREMSEVEQAAAARLHEELQAAAAAAAEKLRQANQQAAEEQAKLAAAREAALNEVHERWGSVFHPPNCFQSQLPITIIRIPPSLYISLYPGLFPNSCVRYLRRDYCVMQAREIPC